MTCHQQVQQSQACGVDTWVYYLARPALGPITKSSVKSFLPYTGALAGKGKGPWYTWRAANGVSSPTLLSGSSSNTSSMTDSQKPPPPSQNSRVALAANTHASRNCMWTRSPPVGGCRT